MSEESIRRAVRHAKRTRRLGPDARCSNCGAVDVTVLQHHGECILCYECAAARQGKITFEEHHLLGKTNVDLTISLPGNLHREVSDRRYDWPESVRTNPDREPLRWAAGLCYGVRDLLAVLDDWLERVANWLLALSEALEEALGTRWWVTLGVDTPWGKAAS
jgi:hypothetical protein